MAQWMKPGIKIVPLSSVTKLEFQFMCDADEAQLGQAAEHQITGLSLKAPARKLIIYS